MDTRSHGNPVPELHKEATQLIKVLVAEDSPVTREFLGYTLAETFDTMIRHIQTNYQAIERAKHEWETSLDAVSDPLFIHDWEFKVLRCNRAYAEAAGMSYQEIIGKPYYEVFPKTDEPTEGCRKALERQEDGEEEIAVPAVDRVFNAKFFFVRDADGAYLYSLHVLQDVTARKKAEEASRESEEKFRAISDGALDAVLMLDDGGRIVYWNPAASRIFGYSPEEALGRDVHTFLAPRRYHDASGEGWGAFRESGRGPVIGKVLELSALRKDGAEFPIELSVSALKLKGRWHAVGILRDVTERKRMENELRESEARYRRITEGLTDYQYTVRIENGRSVETTQSPACVTVTGYTAEEYAAISHLWIQMVVPEDRELVMKHEQQILAGDDVSPIEHRITRKNGETRWISDTAILFRDASGKLMSYDGVIKDITERKKAETELFRLNRVLKTMSECNRTLLRASDETELMRNMCQVITGSGGYSLAWIGLARQDGNKSIEAVAIAGEGKGYVEALNLTWDDRPNGHGPTGTTVRTGRTQVVQDIKNDPRFELWREATAKYGYASSIALPLNENGVVFGTLNIYAAEASAFGDDEVALLEEVADDMVFGIVNLRTGVERDQAVKGRQHYIERLRESLEEALQAIATTVEMRDPYTAGHQRRVAHLAAAIAHELGLPEERVHGIHLAGIVHDLGKIHVPAEVLSKPGRLDDIEFSFIKTHSQVGYDILKEIQFPWPIAQAVLQHHERLDGSGYPHGLKGDAIILEARILAVADVVEAMSSHRPYRPGLGIDAALAEISSKRGIQFDPQVVDACLALFHEQHYGFNE